MTIVPTRWGTSDDQYVYQINQTTLGLAITRRCVDKPDIPPYTYVRTLNGWESVLDYNSEPSHFATLDDVKTFLHDVEYR